MRHGDEASYGVQSKVGAYEEERARIFTTLFYIKILHLLTFIHII